MKEESEVQLLVNLYILILTCILLGVTGVMAFCGNFCCTQTPIASFPIEREGGSIVLHICSYPGFFGSIIGILLLILTIFGFRITGGKILYTIFGINKEK